MWEIINKKEHWLEIQEPGGWYSASLKWDGCIDFNRYYNDPKYYQEAHPSDNNLSDYLHICDIDDMIKRLEKLRDIGKKHFGKDWGD